MSDPKHSILLSFTLLLGACATAVPIREVPVLLVAPVQDNDCAYILRDLSIDWALRHYWCGGSRTQIQQSKSDQAHKDKLILAEIERTRLHLADLRQRIDVMALRTNNVATKITPHLEKLDPVENKPILDEAQKNALDEHQVSPDAVVTHSANSNKTFNVVFARGRESLGPKGNLQALNLITNVRNAHRITLRGRIVADEFLLATTKADERRSVGRSLSVRELWSASGVDVTKVTILHHTPGLSGTYVEVSVYE